MYSFRFREFVQKVHKELNDTQKLHYRHVGWCQDVHDEWGQAMFSMQVEMKKIGLKYYDAECAVDNYIDTIYKDVEVNKNIDDVDCKGNLEEQLYIMVKTVNQCPDMDY